MLKQLIAKFRHNNDQQAFNDIVKATQSELRGYCRRLTAGDIALADDIAQESLIIAYQQLGKLNNVDAFKSWLYRIAYRNFLAQIKKQPSYEETKTESIAHEDNCDDELLILQLMKCLSENQRAVLTLNITLGYRHEEISSMLDMPLGSVKSHCKRGKDKLLALAQQQQLGAA